MLLDNLKMLILNSIGRCSGDGKGMFIVSYIHNRGRFPNLNHPKDLSEICIKRVLDGKINKLSYLADKYAVREYVESKGLVHILTPLLGVYENANEIDFSKLPNRFALKANFGAGMNIICTDKSQLDYDVVKKKTTQWLTSGVYSLSERHYNLIPKKIVCEEFIDDGTGGFPTDYKLMCIHGKVHCILACSGREKGHAVYLPYSVEWKPMYDYYKTVPPKIDLLKAPKNLTKMIHVAEILAEGIEFVRIDLYTDGNRIWFGEITLTPAGCIFHRWSNKALDEMGRLFYNKNL